MFDRCYFWGWDFAMRLRYGNNLFVSMCLRVSACLSCPIYLLNWGKGIWLLFHTVTLNSFALLYFHNTVNVFSFFYSIFILALSWPCSLLLPLSSTLARPLAFLLALLFLSHSIAGPFRPSFKAAASRCWWPTFSLTWNVCLYAFAWFPAFRYRLEHCFQGQNPAVHIPVSRLKF